MVDLDHNSIKVSNVAQFEEGSKILPEPETSKLRTALDRIQLEAKRTLYSLLFYPSTWIAPDIHTYIPYLLFYHQGADSLITMQLGMHSKHGIHPCLGHPLHIISIQRPRYSIKTTMFVLDTRTLEG